MPGYIFLAGSVVCLAVSVGVGVEQNMANKDYPRAVDGAFAVLSFLPIAALSTVHGITKELGKVTSFIAFTSTALSFLFGLNLLIAAILPHSSCDPRCPGP